MCLTFFGPVTTGSCGLALFTAHDASDGRHKKGKERVRIFIFFLKNLVNLLKSLVAPAYVDCMACAPRKRLCVEYTTFARKATYCVRIAQFLHVSDLCAQSNLYVRSTTFARKAT